VFPTQRTKRASDPIVIRAENLSKQYVIDRNPRGGETFREALMKTLTAPLHYFAHGRAAVAEKETFWALKDVNFEICKGEIVGIIGRNGAGKSTLLKILSRITEPTEGRIEICGRVASLLEVGTGFHGELTGRENVYLNGAILGMTRSEIDRKFDDIVNFAEVGQFLETPVKHYSSGMGVRLAFAVAAHLEPDILLVDEVLAVGDVQFQNKCLGKMEDVAGLGRTVLLVSHNMSAIERLCSRSIVLESGKVNFTGNTVEAISNLLSSSTDLSIAMQAIGPLRESVSVRAVQINGRTVNQKLQLMPKSELRIDLELFVAEKIPEARVVISVTKTGQKVIDLYDAPAPENLPRGFANIRATLPPFFLSPGDYSLTIVCYAQGTALWTSVQGAAFFSILPESCSLYDIGRIGLVHLTNQCKRLSVGSQESTLRAT
jgi:lipopolysaccharide transport system ATP-binding protein